MTWLTFIAEKYPAHEAKPLPPIIHYTSPEPFTKYEICLVLASLSNPPLAHGHIQPDAAEPVIPPGGVGRPKDCKLSVRIVEAKEEEGGLGMDIAATGFEEWWRQELAAK